jgi:hypothetical protein
MTSGLCRRRPHGDSRSHVPETKQPSLGAEPCSDMAGQRCTLSESLNTPDEKRPTFSVSARGSIGVPLRASKS